MLNVNYISIKINEMMEEIYHANINLKKIGVAKLILDKVDFRAN